MTPPARPTGIEYSGGAPMTSEQLAAYHSPADEEGEVEEIHYEKPFDAPGRELVEG